MLPCVAPIAGLGELPRVVWCSMLSRTGQGASVLKLFAKFNILLILVFGLGLFLIAYEAQNFLQDQAQAEVLREAGLMAATL